MYKNMFSDKLIWKLTMFEKIGSWFSRLKPLVGSVLRRHRKFEFSRTRSLRDVTGWWSLFLYLTLRTAQPFRRRKDKKHFVQNAVSELTTKWNWKRLNKMDQRLPSQFQIKSKLGVRKMAWTGFLQLDLPDLNIVALNRTACRTSDTAWNEFTSVKSPLFTPPLFIALWLS